MAGINAASYEQFAPFYAALTRATGRTQREADLLVELLERFGVNPDAAILDLGCGPGAVLRELGARGYSRLHGVDVAEHMVTHARRQAPSAHVARVSWMHLHDAFASVSPFLAVYSLSQTITHADTAEIPTVCAQVARSLEPGGYFFIDVRAWHEDSQGNRIEPNRPPHVWRLGPLIQVPVGSYWIDDRCWYEGGRQHVQYRFRRKTPGDTGWDTEQTFRVSYNTLDCDEYVAMLRASGFEHVDVLMHKDWPYLIIAARALSSPSDSRVRPDG
ncbi:MAG: methyltransferase domain-containing protein [Planctomycetota bacterium]|nr:methyltransferase domain-containing protein [Planctomycetota bacterium]